MEEDEQKKKKQMRRQQAMTKARRGKARRREVEEERRSESEAYNWQIRRCLAGRRWLAVTCPAVLHPEAMGLPNAFTAWQLWCDHL